MGLTICAAVVPDGWDVEIVDENVSDDRHSAVDDVDAVGISVMTSQAIRAYEIADEYRKLGVKVILGGVHVSAMPSEAKEHCDIVCKGDAESTLPRALNDLTAGNSKKVYDWADYPDTPIATPRKDLLNPDDYLVFNPVQTMRGCPHSCEFCTTPSIFGNRFRRRDVGDIIEEMRRARELYNTPVFIFSDDNVAGNQKWAMELFEAMRELDIRWASQCDILVARNEKLLAAMRDSGCLGLILGLESPIQSTLESAGKKFVSADMYLEMINKIQSYNISLWGSFIFGFDTDGWRECMHSVRFARKAKLAMSCYIILTPYPGTAIYDRFLAEGRLLDCSWDQYNGATVCYRPERMTVDELRHAQMAAFREFYSFGSAFSRLGVYPFKKNSWLTNLAIQKGLNYYYRKKGRPLPGFADFVSPRAAERIARSLGNSLSGKQELKT